MSPMEMLFAGYCLVSGVVLGWLWAEAPLKRRILELETRLKWETALKLAAESDLLRIRKKAEKLTPPRKKAKKGKR